MSSADRPLFRKNEPCCPSCWGTSGVQANMTETHVMGAAWGGQLSAGDSGRNVKMGLAECLDCGKRFQVNALQRKELLS